MCLRCSPGLFRHACGVASCHTSSMAAKPHLGLTQNSSPTTLANERRAAQNRGVQRQSPGRPPQRAKCPIVPSARRNGRNPPAKGHGPRRRPCGGGRRGPSIPLGVGAGIPDGPGWNAPWTRQGCRVLRNGYGFAPVRRLTLPGTARRHTQVPPYKHGRTAPHSSGGG